MRCWEKEDAIEERARGREKERERPPGFLSQTEESGHPLIPGHVVHPAAAAEEEALAAVAARAAAAVTASLSTSSGVLLCLISLLLFPLGMSLLGAYKKKSSYDGYESLQLVDSGGDSFSIGRGSSGGTLGGSIAATLGPKAGPLREEDCSTMDSSGKSPYRLRLLYEWRLEPSWTRKGL